MTINFLPQPRRSVGALRRGASRAVVAILFTLMLSSFSTYAARSRTRLLQPQTSIEGGGAVSLPSQVGACTAERASLQKFVKAAQENCRSWRRPQFVLDALATELPSEIWLQKLSITGAEIEIVGVARSPIDLETFVSSPEFKRNIERAQIVAMQDVESSRRRVFHVTAQAPSLGMCGVREEAPHAVD